jgi:hypothetical protein
MHAGFGLALALAFAFAVTNGLLGPLVLGAAVADTIGGIVTLAPQEAIQVIGAGLAAAVIWNVLTWWRGLPRARLPRRDGGVARERRSARRHGRRELYRRISRMGEGAVDVAERVVYVVVRES